MAVFPIDDAGDPRIVDYRNIPDPALRRDQIFVAEGRLVVRRLLASKRLATRSLMVTAPALAALRQTAELGDIPIFLVSQALMNSVTGFNIHRGCLAIGERGVPPDWPTLTACARRVVILERVGNADNVGAIFRNAAAFGVDAVLLGPECADPLYRKAIRTSMAAALTIPFAPLEPWPAALASLRDHGFGVIALSPCLDARSQEARPEAAAPTVRDAIGAMTAGTRVAILAGHEGEGLTREALAACDTVARIPMAPFHDSLNVATAVAVALYDLFTIHQS